MNAFSFIFIEFNFKDSFSVSFFSVANCFFFPSQFLFFLCRFYVNMLDFAKLDSFNIFAMNLSIWIILGTVFQVAVYSWNLPKQIQGICLCYNLAAMLIHYSFLNDYISSSTKLLLLQYDLVFCCFLAALYTGNFLVHHFSIFLFVYSFLFYSSDSLNHSFYFFF